MDNSPFSVLIIKFKPMKKSQSAKQQPAEPTHISINILTWLKDSHSLFDYDFTKNIKTTDEMIPLFPSYVFFYRDNKCTLSDLSTESEVFFRQQKDNKAPLLELPTNSIQLLGCFRILQKDGKTFLRFSHAE